MVKYLEYSGDDNILYQKPVVIEEEETIDPDKIKIYFTLDEQNFLSSWSTSQNPQEPEEHSLVLPLTHGLLLLGNCRVFEYVDNDIVYNEEKALEFAKREAVYRISSESMSSDRVLYENIYYPYTQEVKENYQQILNNFTFLGQENSIKIEGFDSTNKEITTLFSKEEFSVFYGYCLLYQQYKEDLINNFYKPLIKNCKNEDELDAIKWDDSPKEGVPLPEKPNIDTNNDGVVSREEYDKMVKENKSLKQQVDFNEKALLDAINMLSNMIME